LSAKTGRYSGPSDNTLTVAFIYTSGLPPGLHKAHKSNSNPVLVSIKDKITP